MCRCAGPGHGNAHELWPRRLPGPDNLAACCSSSIPIRHKNSRSTLPMLCNGDSRQIQNGTKRESESPQTKLLLPLELPSSGPKAAILLESSHCVPIHSLLEPIVCSGYKKCNVVKDTSGRKIERTIISASDE